MKSIYSLAVVAICCVMLAGCGDKKEEKKETTDKGASTTNVSHETICASCGSAECTKGKVGECDSDAEKCACGFHKGSELCCKDESLKPKDGLYCAKCGFVAKSDDCCKKGAEACSCGMHEGAPLCCKLKKDGHEGHDHDGDDHGTDHDEDKK